jgi:hypothetical protein
MNKSQSIDGIIGPHHANGQHSSVALKAEAAQSVRRVYKNIIAQELEEIDPEILDFENNHGQRTAEEAGIMTGRDRAFQRARVILDENRCYGAELRHLVADVQKLMADAKVFSSDAQFVNHSCGSITWEEFVASMREFTYYQGTWNIEGLTDLFCVVGTDWWIKVSTWGDYEGLYFYRSPRRLPYHITSTAECFNPAF